MKTIYSNDSLYSLELNVKGKKRKKKKEEEGLKCYIFPQGSLNVNGLQKPQWARNTTLNFATVINLSIKKRLDFMSSTDFIFEVTDEPEYIGDQDIKT